MRQGIVFLLFVITMIFWVILGMLFVYKSGADDGGYLTFSENAPSEKKYVCEFHDELGDEDVIIIDWNGEYNGVFCAKCVWEFLVTNFGQVKEKED